MPFSFLTALFAFAVVLSATPLASANVPQSMPHSIKVEKSLQRRAPTDPYVGERKVVNLKLDSLQRTLTAGTAGERKAMVVTNKKPGIKPVLRHSGGFRVVSGRLVKRPGVSQPLRKIQIKASQLQGGKVK
ncbi:MAG: hypothetical protein AB1540_17430 [Bdellovibrionota bacterium]